MPDINTMLQWYQDRINNVYYSMTYRNGQLINSNGYLDNSGKPGFDCSSAGYYALKAGGFFPDSTPIGNTDSMFNDLERNGWSKLQPNAQGNFDTLAGDVVIWGKRGASTGDFGHFMAFLNANDVIHCNSYYNSIHVNNYDGLWEANGEPEATFYRYTGAGYAPPSIQGSPTDQVLDIGSTIRFDGTFIVDDMQQVNGEWQVRTNALCPVGFTWDDNGIPIEPLIEVDASGNATADQKLSVGSAYKIPGKFAVQDLGQTNGVWLALISWNGQSWWVDTAPATEISPSDPGTNVPTAPTPSIPAPDTSSSGVSDSPIDSVASPSPSTEVLTPSQNPVTVEKPKTNTPPKEDTMAFTPDQQKQLNIQTQDVQTLADEVAAQNQDLVSGIPKNAKLTVYIVGDTLLGLGAISPQAVVLVTSHDPFVFATTLSSLLATSGLFLLTMFGIYKSGK